MTPDETTDPAVIRGSWDDPNFTDVTFVPVEQHDDAAPRRATGVIVPERQRCICPDGVCVDHCRACNHSGRDLEEACIADPDWQHDDATDAVSA